MNVCKPSCSELKLVLITRFHDPVTIQWKPRIMKSKIELERETFKLHWHCSIVINVGNLSGQ